MITVGIFPTTAPFTPMVLRAGTSLPLTVVVNNPAVAQMVTPSGLASTGSVAIAGERTTTGFTIRGVAAGSSTIAVNPSAGESGGTDFFFRVTSP